MKVERQSVVMPKPWSQRLLTVVITLLKDTIVSAFAASPRVEDTLSYDLTGKVQA
jgi:hypothetical protein